MKKRTYTERKNAAREKSLRELAEFRGDEYFSTIAEIRAARRAYRYGLVREFRENAII